MMEFKAFENKEGKGLLSIRISDIGSYFRLSKPVTVAWFDYDGTLGKYLCQLPYDQQERSAIIKQMDQALYHDYAADLDALKTLLDPLLEAFPQGHYVLQLHDGDKGDYFRIKRSGANDVFKWYLAESTLITDISDLASREAVFGEYVVDKLKYPDFDLINKTVNGFYVDDEVILVTTQPKSIINEERVRFFEEQIVRGERPFAITFRCVYKRGDDMQNFAESDRYIIDGHHKLLAYQRQKVLPRIVELTHFAESIATVVMDVEELLEVLYPWQLKHLLDNWEFKPRHIASAMKNPNSKLHQYIKNGPIREYHYDGQLKHEARYVNGGMEGIGRWWYDNGQLEREYALYDGRLMGASKGWFRDGKQAYVLLFDEEGRQHGEGYYYNTNGGIRVIQSMQHGKQVDGISHYGWYDGGMKEFENEFKNNKMIGRKRYDIEGNVIELHEWDPVTGTLVRKL